MAKKKIKYRTFFFLIDDRQSHLFVVLLSIILALIGASDCVVDQKILPGVLVAGENVEVMVSKKRVGLQMRVVVDPKILPAGEEEDLWEKAIVVMVSKRRVGLQMTVVVEHLVEIDVMVVVVQDLF
jgi:hypothetical protein